MGNRNLFDDSYFWVSSILRRKMTCNTVLHLAIKPDKLNNNTIQFLLQ